MTYEQQWAVRNYARAKEALSKAIEGVISTDYKSIMLRDADFELLTDGMEVTVTKRNSFDYPIEKSISIDGFKLYAIYGASMEEWAKLHGYVKAS